MHEPGVDRGKHQASWCQNSDVTLNSPAFCTFNIHTFLEESWNQSLRIRLFVTFNLASVWDRHSQFSLPGCSGGASKSSVLLRKQMRRTRWKMARKNEKLLKGGCWEHCHCAGRNLPICLNRIKRPSKNENSRCLTVEIWVRREGELTFAGHLTITMGAEHCPNLLMKSPAIKTMALSRKCLIKISELQVFKTLEIQSLKTLLLGQQNSFEGKLSRIRWCSVRS